MTHEKEMTMQFVLICKSGDRRALTEAADFQIIRESGDLVVVGADDEAQLRGLLGDGWVVSPKRTYRLC
jgi:hypothetical protein